MIQSLRHETKVALSALSARLAKHAFDHSAIRNRSGSRQTWKVRSMVVDAQGVVDRCGDVFGATGACFRSGTFSVGRTYHSATMNTCPGKK